MWDKILQNDVTRRGALYVEGVEGLPMPQLGVWGSCPGKFFLQI